MLFRYFALSLVICLVRSLLSLEMPFFMYPFLYVCMSLVRLVCIVYVVRSVFRCVVISFVVYVSLPMLCVVLS